MASLIPKTNSASGSATAPAASALVSGELAENKYTGRLYVKTESNAVVDPARVTLTGDVTGTTATATTETQAGTIAATVAKIQGNAVQSATPAGSDTLVWSTANSRWEPKSFSSSITSVALSAASTISVAPSSANDLVNKTYADSIGSGINFHDAADYGTIAALSPSATYNNGTSGVGATLTGATNAILQVDGVTVAVGNRILVKNQTDQTQNGIYVVTRQGNTTTLPYILTRASDYDTSGSGSNEVQAGDFVLVLNSTLANTAWVQQTQGTIVFGLSNIVFTQFAAASGVTTFSGGTTGLTPSTASNGAVVLAGTLDVNNGGTGAATFTSGALLKGAGILPITTATSGTDYVAGADVSAYKVTAVLDSNLAVATPTATKLTFTTGTQTAIDTHTIAQGDIIFLTAQNTSSQKGPWVVSTVGATGVAAVWDRPAWWTTNTARAGVLFSASQGTTYQGSIWSIYPTAVFNSGITVGATGLTAVNLYSKTGIPIASGGTGAVTEQAALNALAGGSAAISPSIHWPLISNGTNVVFAPLDLNSSGSVGDSPVSGQLSTYNGGTGNTGFSINTNLAVSGFGFYDVAASPISIDGNYEQVIWLTGTGTSIIYLPDMTVEQNGVQFRIINKSNGTVTMRLFGTTTALCTIVAGSTRLFIGAGGSNVAASWAFLPSQTTNV